MSAYFLFGDRRHVLDLQQTSDGTNIFKNTFIPSNIKRICKIFESVLLLFGERIKAESNVLDTLVAHSAAVDVTPSRIVRGSSLHVTRVLQTKRKLKGTSRKPAVYIR